MLKTLEDLILTIRERKSSPDENSYTTKLLNNKSNKTQLSHSQYELVKNTMSKYFGPYSGYAQQFLYYRDS